MYNETISIYVNSDESVEAFARECEKAFGIELSTNLQHTHGFSYADSKQWLVIHEQLDYRALEGEVADFPYWIEIGSYAPRYSDRLRYTSEFAQLIYDKLRATQKYSFLMLGDAELSLGQSGEGYRQAG
jgi:hypothetical protein